ncbi:MAG: endolytic transglycosylase MltG [Actinomycetes bacterium]
MSILAIGGWYAYEASGPGGTGNEATIEVTKGESFAAIRSSLAARGVIGSSFAFRLDALIHGTPNVFPGFYAIPRSSNFAAIRAVLESGPNTHPLIVPPGFTLHEITQRSRTAVSAKFARGVRMVLAEGTVTSPYSPVGSVDLEGLVGPGRYLITPMTSPTSFVHSMVQRFNGIAQAAGLKPSSSRSGLTAYQLVTVASVVEKEGYQTRNMPKVATTIFNRLDRSMILQMDSTVLYALGQDGGPVTRATLRHDSPYNTYLHKGLPPTPICVVSSDAINATMHPPAGSWLFFTVIDKTGTEAFSDTFDEQLANERLAAARGL